MMTDFRNALWRDIENRGRAEGLPVLKFDNRKIISQGPEHRVPYDLWYFFTGVSGFYLSVPPNTFGILIHPNGQMQERPVGGIQAVPPGVYKTLFVDLRERSDSTQPVTDIALDGETLSLRLLFRYRVSNPMGIQTIDRPIETLIELLQADLAQYIRTHSHTEITDRGIAREDGQITQYFLERHQTRQNLADAIEIENIELKEFTPDSEYVNLRRNTLMQQRQTQFERQLLDSKNEIERLRTTQRMEIERLTTEANAQTTALRDQILRETQRQNIRLETMRTQTQRRHELLVKAVDAVGLAVEHSSYSRNPGEIRNAISNLLDAIKENAPSLDEVDHQNGNTAPSGATSRPSFTGNQKIEDLTNTLLDLLNPQK